MIMQERHQAAADRAAATEQRLREEVTRLQAALQASHASRSAQKNQSVGFVALFMPIYGVYNLHDLGGSTKAIVTQPTYTPSAIGDGVHQKVIAAQQHALMRASTVFQLYPSHLCKHSLL